MVKVEKNPQGLRDAGCSDPEYCSIFADAVHHCYLAQQAPKKNCGLVTLRRRLHLQFCSIQVFKPDAEMLRAFIAGNPAGTGDNGAHDKEERLDR